MSLPANSKILSAWFKLDWSDFIKCVPGFEVRVKGVDYIIYRRGEYNIATGLTRLELIQKKHEDIISKATRNS